MLLKILVLALGINAFAIEAFAKEEVIELANGQEIVANFQKSQKSSNGEVFVLLNGLVYELNRWDKVANGRWPSPSNIGNGTRSFRQGN